MRRYPIAAKTMRLLREQLPTNFHVRTKWVAKCEGGSMATCTLIERRGRRPYFLIELSKGRLEPILEASRSRIVLWETIVHEYAHALAWTPAHRNLKDHGPLWGVAYSMCYVAAEKLL